MNLFKEFKDQITATVVRLSEEGKLPKNIQVPVFTVEPPREAKHGDVSTNIALVLAKHVGQKPAAIAPIIIEGLKAEPSSITATTVAGPGFINLTLGDDFWRGCLRQILKDRTAYGDSRMGGGTPVNVEYVSANPTGPMHVGHGRGAAVGDALAGLLAKAGFAVTREYYVNDAGAQVEALARSLHYRYRQTLGDDPGPMPDGLYPGDYLVAPAEKLAMRDGKKWLGKPESEWLEPLRAFAVDEMLALIRADLEAFGIRFDVFSSERALAKAGKVDEALEFLKASGLIYEGVLEPPKGKLPDDWEPRPQTLFRATQFGDDVDRPLKKSDGSWTYFATDIAYHLDKYRRGFATMIDVWGADHGGYVKRMQAAVKALSGGKAALDVKLCQLVNLFDAGEPVRMSKRAGTFVTLRDVIDRVGKDVARFIMLTRKNDQHLDFDFAKAMEHSRDNPVFYVQYAHARVRSIMRHAGDLFGPQELTPQALAAADLAALADPAEIALIKKMAAWPRLVESAAEAHEPHRVAYYLYEIAGDFHNLWNKGNDNARLRFIIPEDKALTHARLALVQALGFVIASGLAVFAVAPVEEMR